MSEATPTSSVLPFFLGSFARNFTLGMSNPPAPLHTHHLGMSGIGIGTLVALLWGLALMPVRRWAFAKPDTNMENQAGS